MKKDRKHIAWTIVLLFCSCMWCVRCQGPPPLPSFRQVALGVVIPDDTTHAVARVEVTVKGPGLSPEPRQTLDRLASQWVGAIQDLPAGKDRVFHAVAYDAAGKVLYRGQSSAMATSQQQSNAVVILLQPPAPVVPFQNASPSISEVTVSSYQIGPGETIDIGATAQDPDPGDTLSYSWSAASGTFGNAKAARTTWTAPLKPGNYLLSIVVQDGQEGQAAMGLVMTVEEQYIHRAESRSNRSSGNDPEHDNGKDDDKQFFDDRGDQKGTRYGKAKVSILRFNVWPIVHKVWADQGLLKPGQRVPVHMTASDPDGDPITILWSDNCGGTFHDPTVRNTVWTAPAQAPPQQSCVLRATVKDQYGGLNWGLLRVWVGYEPPVNLAPQASTFQSVEQVKPGEVVVFRLVARDPESHPMSFAWGAPFGRLFDLKTVGNTSEVRWQAPPQCPAQTVEIQGVVRDSYLAQNKYTFTVTCQP